MDVYLHFVEGIVHGDKRLEVLRVHAVQFLAYLDLVALVAARVMLFGQLVGLDGLGSRLTSFCDLSLKIVAKKILHVKRLLVVGW